MNYYVFTRDGNFLIVKAESVTKACDSISGSWNFLRKLSGFEQAFIETWK